MTATATEHAGGAVNAAIPGDHRSSSEAAPATERISRTSEPVATADRVSGAELEASFTRCAAITREHAKNFYHGLKLAPREKRGELYAVYAWMRAADDCVDDAPDPSAARGALDAFESTTWRWLGDDPRASGDGVATGIWPAFRQTVARAGIDHAVLRGMIHGQASDIGRSVIQTERELTRYCEGVAGTVGLACLSVWGVRPGRSAEHARTLALRRGQAFQRTNILRDLGEDMRASSPRCYLPVERLARYGMTPETLFDPGHRARAVAMIGDAVRETRAFYDAASAFDDLIDPACAPVSRTMTRIYRAVLDKIERDPARVLAADRIGLSTRRKLWLGARGLAERWWRR